MKVAVIGMGARGINYSKILTKEFQTSIVAVCDKDEKKLNIAREQFHTPNEMLFLDEDEFFAKGRLADICIVSTQDGQHRGHAIKAMDAGYDLLLEKPIATTWEDCNAILRKAEELNRKIFVCHVLRYAPFFHAIRKELDSGKYGKVITVNLTENVGYWHQAHSYVRGAWRNAQTSSPMIMAKSCHDLDILLYLVGENFKTVSSMGSLSYFREENAPDGSAKRCVDCKYQETCAYSAVKYYLRERAEKGYFGWPVSTITTDYTVEGIEKALKEGAYGRCVFRCDNDVVDHQVVNFTFDGGATACFTMTAFSNYSFREIAVHCEKGVIRGNALENELRCYVFGEEDTTALRKPRVINTDNSLDNDYGHGGGDYLLLKGLVEYYAGENEEVRTAIRHSMQSHYAAFKAEESRLNDGQAISLKDFMSEER